MHLIAFQYACFLTQLVLCVIRGRVSATEREALRPALTSSGIESFEVKCWDNLSLSNWRKEKNSRNKKKNETYKTSSASFGFVADTKKLTHLTLWAKRTRMKPRAGTFRKHKFERSKICKIKRQKKTGEKMWKGDLWTLTQRSKKRSWNAKT